MLRQHSAKLKYIALAFDVLITVMCLVATTAIRDKLLGVWRFGDSVEMADVQVLLALIVIVWVPLLYYQYKDLFRRFTSLATEIRITFNVIGVGTLLVVAMAFFLRVNIPRSLLVIFVVVNFISLVVEKAVTRELLHLLISCGYSNKAVLIVGAGTRGRDLARTFRLNPQWGLVVRGFIDKIPEMTGMVIDSIPVLGGPHNLSEIMHQHAVEEVIFAVPLRNLEEIHDMLRLCEEEGVPTHVVSDFFKTRVSKVYSDRIYGVPILSFVTSPRNDLQLAVKRMVDLLVSGLLLIFLAPLLGVIALLIKLSSRGPVFYAWRVVGYNKKPFVGYKFRTMVVNADEIKERLMMQNEMTGPVFKIKDDPRVTKIGRWLRKFSLDELPQLWSVFKGDMSLVGPRPPLQSELARFESWHRRKLSVKPGLICLREVNGRSNITEFDDWVRLDLEYIDNWSFWQDVKILIKLIPAVFTGKGAY